jgi:hypothetical protein
MVHLSRHQLTNVYKELVPIENITVLKKGPKSLEFGRCETSSIEGDKKAFFSSQQTGGPARERRCKKKDAGEIAAERFPLIACFVRTRPLQVSGQLCRSALSHRQ